MHIIHTIIWTRLGIFVTFECLNWNLLDLIIGRTDEISRLKSWRAILKTSRLNNTEPGKLIKCMFSTLLEMLSILLYLLVSH